MTSATGQPSATNPEGAAFQPAPIRWSNLGWAGLVIAGMIAVIASDSVIALNFLHVGTGVLWTGIDLFMGFVVGPALRRVPFEARRAMMTQLTPRTMFILPTLAIVTGTTGWYLAKAMGYLAAPYPGRWWIIAALLVVAVLTISGLGVLLPTQIKVYRELCKNEPDRDRIARLSGSYFYIIALQGLMQVAMVFIMARFRMGL